MVRTYSDPFTYFEGVRTPNLPGIYAPAVVGLVNCSRKPKQLMARLQRKLR